MAALRLLGLVAALAAGPGAAHAQAAIELRHVTIEKADFGDARLGGLEEGLLLRTPEFDVAQGRLDFAADYTYTHYDYSGLATRDRDLHRLELPLTWTGGGDVHARLGLVPTVAASSNVFKDLFSRGGSDDYSLYGHASVERTPQQGWGWRAGAAYDDAFGDRRVYPLLSLLRRDGAVTFELGWPRTHLDWQANAHLRLAFDVFPAGGRWHVVSDERDGAEFFYTTEAWRGSFALQWLITPHWQLDAVVGYEFDRHHEFEDDTGALIDRDVDSAALYGLNLYFRF